MFVLLNCFLNLLWLMIPENYYNNEARIIVNVKLHRITVLIYQIILCSLQVLCMLW